MAKCMLCASLLHQHAYSILYWFCISQEYLYLRNEIQLWSILLVQICIQKVTDYTADT